MCILLMTDYSSLQFVRQYDQTPFLFLNINFVATMQRFCVNMSQKTTRSYFLSNGKHYYVNECKYLTYILILEIYYIHNHYSTCFRYKFNDVEETEFYRYTPPKPLYNDPYTSSQNIYHNQQYNTYNNNDNRATSSYIKDGRKYSSQRKIYSCYKIRNNTS